MASAVALDDTTVAFRLADDRIYTAVKDARLAIGEGEFVAIVGPTGCGKSTLLNVAAGLLKPVSGSVRIFGAPLAGLNRDAGYLFQADALFPWKTAIDNVAIGPEIEGVGRTEALRRAQAALERASAAAREGVPGEIVALELREALFAIGEVTGRGVSDDLLDRIFSRFCIGK